jgi:hypothetical protein
MAFDSMTSLNSRPPTRARNRFLQWFFGIGTFVPVILFIGGSVLGQRLNWDSEGHLGSALWILTWLVWPSWIVLLDAEHWYQLIPAMLFAAPLNGVWYGIIGLLVWHLRRGLNKSVASRPQSREDQQ